VTAEPDIVIVGAGSAGCALAYRLGEAGLSVTVIEHGGTDAGPFIQMPAALSFPMNMARYDWGLRTEPEPHLGGRVLATPRGKVLGGSSSINGMVYVRGHARDYDHWAEQGAAGWAYADVLPYFKRMETWHGGPEGGDDADWRGHDGPLHITRGPRSNPLFDAFIAAGQQAGYPVTQDYNGQSQEGFGPMEARRQGAHRTRTCAARGDRERSRRRCRDRTGSTHPGRPGRARGRARRLVDQHAETSDAVGHRPRRPPDLARHSGRG
jgi:choline dehydrogenase